MLTISLIIPVYNEERHIKACLEAISRQVVRPTEVIVVDNNCTDNTIAIARSYPFVRVIHESKQGLIAARNAGFVVATSDIYGRIDADSRLDPDWCERVIAHFDDAPESSGLTGPGRTDILPYFPWPKSKLLSEIYFSTVAYTTGVQVMWGANMALRASAWESIQDETHQVDDEVHEDQDISLLMWANSLPIDKDNFLSITTSGQQYRYMPKAVFYTIKHRRTLQLHTVNGTLEKARVYEQDYSTRLARLLVSIPIIIYIWICVIVPFPIDYIWERIKSLRDRR